MHVVQLFLINYEDILNAGYESKTAVHDKISTTISDLTNDGSSWFDYYDFGGRWDDFFPQLAKENNLNFNNPTSWILPYKNNENLFEVALKEIVGYQNKTFIELRDRITGGAVAISDHNEGVFGIQTRSDPAVAQRITEGNKASAKEWEHTLKAKNLKDARESSTFNMGMYYTKRFIQLVENEWNDDSHYYYAFLGSGTNPQIILDKQNSYLQIREEDLQKSALIALDFHF